MGSCLSQIGKEDSSLVDIKRSKREYAYIKRYGVACSVTITVISGCQKIDYI